MSLIWLYLLKGCVAAGWRHQRRQKESRNFELNLHVVVEFGPTGGGLSRDMGLPKHKQEANGSN
jgi:hypothetical protein